MAERKSRRDEESSALRSTTILLCTLGTVLTFIVMVTFNGFATVSAGQDIGLFKSSTTAVSDFYFLEITPSGATFSIWGAIYLWNALLVFYGVANLCRKTSSGPLYVKPGPLPLSFFVIYMFNNVFNIAWLLLWDSQYIEWSCFVLWVISVSLYLSIILVARHINSVRVELDEAGTGKDFWFVQAFTMNGLGLYVGWTSCAMNLNLAHALIYGKYTDVEQSIGSTVALAVLGTMLVGYAISDFAFLDRWTRYLLTPYIPVMAALSGGIVKNWDPEKRNSVITAVLLGLTGLFFLIKVVLTIIRHRAGRNQGGMRV